MLLYHSLYLPTLPLSIPYRPLPSLSPYSYLTHSPSTLADMISPREKEGELGLRTLHISTANLSYDPSLLAIYCHISYTVQYLIRLTVLSYLVYRIWYTEQCILEHTRYTIQCTVYLHCTLYSVYIHEYTVQCIYPVHWTINNIILYPIHQIITYMYSDIITL